MYSRSDHCLSLVLFLQEAGSAEDDRRSQPRRYVHRPASNLICSSTSILKSTFMSQIFIATLDWAIIFVFEENNHFSFYPSYDMQHLHQGEYSDRCMTNERNMTNIQTLPEFEFLLMYVSFSEWVTAFLICLFWPDNRSSKEIKLKSICDFRLCNNQYLCLRKELKI